MEKAIYAKKANLINELCGPEPLTGIIHSRFRSVINIRLEAKSGTKRLVTLMAGSRHMVPDSIVIDEQDFKSLSVLDTGSRVIMQDGILKFSNGMVCLIKGFIPNEGRIEFETCNSQEEGFEHNKSCNNILDAPGRLPSFSTKLWDFLTFRCGLQSSQTYIGNKRKQLDALASALINIDYRQALYAMEGCTGYGIGLTPSADDAIVGIMALIEGAWKAGYLPAGSNSVLSDDESSSHSVGHGPEQEASGYEAYKDMMNKLLHSFTLEGRTTDVSMKYLYCAMEGRFSDYLIELVRWVFTGYDKELWSLIRDISEVGASSGTDMLTGMGIACKKLLKALGVTMQKALVVTMLYNREEDFS
jgi:hypothetical protein